MNVSLQRKSKECFIRQQQKKQLSNHIRNKQQRNTHTLTQRAVLPYTLDNCRASNLFVYFLVQTFSICSFHSKWQIIEITHLNIFTKMQQKRKPFKHLSEIFQILLIQNDEEKRINNNWWDLWWRECHQLTSKSYRWKEFFEFIKFIYKL